MAVYFAGKGLLGVVGREEIGGGVGGVARMLLKERKSSVERSPFDGCRKKGVDNGRRLPNRRDEGRGAVLDSGAEACAAQLDREEGLTTRRIVQMAAKNEREG